MKPLFFICFSLLILFINAHANAQQGKNETHPQQNQNQHQKTFLVKTTLTKEQIETLLKQHQEKNKLEDPSQVEPIQLKKKGKPKKNHKKEGVTEAEVPKTEVIEPTEPIDAEKVALGLFDFFFDNNDSDNNDTEDPPEPEKPEKQAEIAETVEKGEVPENAETTAENTANENKEPQENGEIPESAETAAENSANENKEPQEKGEIPESAETAAENSPNEDKENEQVTLLTKEDSTKTANTQSGMTISGFFSLILLTIAFGSFLIYATQPKKVNKNYSNSLNGIKISF